MKIKPKYIAIAIIVAVVVIVSYFISSSFTGQVVEVEPGTYDSFAQCLTDNGAVMYGSASCHACKNQKEMFGDSFEYVNYVECLEDIILCRSRGVSAYPTWEIGGKMYIGSRPLESLASLSGCTLS
jgi:hypothetical protein